MTKKELMHIQSIKDCATSLGFSEDRFGNYILKSPAGEYKLNFGKTSLRYERKIVIEASSYAPKQTIWKNIKSNYYKYITVENGNINFNLNKINTS